MDGWINSIDGWMGGWMDGTDIMDGQMGGCIDSKHGAIYGWMGGWVDG